MQQGGRISVGKKIAGVTFASIGRSVDVNDKTLGEIGQLNPFPPSSRALEPVEKALQPTARF
jgi:hypothetical protein